MMNASNPEFESRYRSDALLKGCITGTLTEEVLSCDVGLVTSAQVWQNP